MSFDKLGSGKPKLEKPAGELPEAENAILNQITPADKEKLRAWRKANLTKERGNIVAIRSEDLLYFLECVHRGYIPVGQGPIRGKIFGGPNDFFVTPNPESRYLKDSARNLLDRNYSGDFSRAVNSNLNIYSDIGRIQAMHRNILTPYNITEEELEELNRKFFHKTFPALEGGTSTEDYLAELAKETETMAEADNCFKLLNKKPALFFLGELLRAKGVKNLDSLAKLLFNMNLKDRGSIFLAFNEKLVRNYEATTDRVDVGGEFVVNVPDGKLSLDTIYGFETLGDFEDEILEQLGV